MIDEGAADESVTSGDQHDPRGVGIHFARSLSQMRAKASRGIRHEELRLVQLTCRRRDQLFAQLLQRIDPFAEGGKRDFFLARIDKDFF